MRIAYLICVSVIFPAAAFSQNQCYMLVNATDHNVTVNYQVPQGVSVGTGFVTGQTFSPGHQERYCTPYRITANIGSPNTVWDGNRAMVMGPGALPPGTYRMVAPPPPQPPIPQRPQAQPQPPPPFQARTIATVGKDNFSTGTNVRYGGPMSAAYGDDTVLNDPPDVNHDVNEGIWKFTVQKPPEDLVWSICYAAELSRPVEVWLNGTLLSPNAAAGTTGGWNSGDRKCLAQGRTNLRDGENTLRIHRDGLFPHIYQITFNQTHP